MFENDKIILWSEVRQVLSKSDHVTDWKTFTTESEKRRQ